MSLSRDSSNSVDDSDLDFGDESTYTPEERALRIITKDFTLNLNQKDVAMRIRDHPMLCLLERARLIQIKRNAKKKMKRVRRTGQQKRQHQTKELGNQGRKQASKEGEDEISMHEGKFKPSSLPARFDGEEIGPSSVTHKLMRERVINILRAATSQGYENELMDAVVSCIIRPEKSSNPELDNLLSLQDKILAKELIAHIRSGSLEKIMECSKEVEPHVVVKSFIDLATEDVSVLKDQLVISEVLLTAINSAADFPQVGVNEIRGAYKVLDACTTLLVDLDKAPDTGYFLFAHKIQMLNKSLSPFKQDKRAKSSLQSALCKIGLSNGVAQMLVKDVDKFCYSDFVEQIRVMSTDEQKAIVKILAKLNPGFDPTVDVQDLRRAFKSRLMLRECLAQREGNIEMTASELLKVITAIVDNNIDKDIVKRIFARDASSWIDQISYLQSSIESGRPITDEQNDRIYSRSKKEIKKELWKELVSLSSLLAQKCESYKSNILQVYIVAKIITKHQQATASLIPTGTGKTFICALLQMYYSSHGERVALVTSQQYLVDQAEAMLGSLRQEMEVMTMKEALRRRDDFTIFIIDEADECCCKYGVWTDEVNQVVTGFWDLLQKRTIFLSATVRQEMEEILHRFFSIRISEYLNFAEEMKDLSPSTCSASIRFIVKKNETEQEQAILKIVNEQYTRKPLLIFVQGAKFVSKIKQTCAQLGIAPMMIMEDDDIASLKLKMRAMDRGVAIVNKRYSRGTDFRFSQDSLVIGTSLPESMQDAVQMAGRSSRTMKHHDCVVIVQHQHLDEKTIVEHLSLAKQNLIREAIRVAKILMGKHAAGNYDDKIFVKHYAKGWLTMSFNIVLRFPKDDIAKFEKLAEELITAQRSEGIPQKDDGSK